MCPLIIATFSAFFSLKVTLWWEKYKDSLSTLKDDSSSELYSPTQSMSLYCRFNRSICSVSVSSFFYSLRIFIWARCSTYSWSVDVLYSSAHTFIDIWRAIPATKLLSISNYKLGFYRYGWGSRTFCNITTDSIYILIHGWPSMTQLLLEHSWRSHCILSSLQRLTNNSLWKSREITFAIAVY